MTKYTTKAGDTFDSIAKKVLGNEKYAKELMEANTKYLTTVIFPGGIELNIPEIEEETSTDNSTLPPWRTG